MNDENTVECIDCLRDVTARNQENKPSEAVPAVGDDDSWRALAREHAPDCQWIATRAHQIPDPPRTTGG